MPNVTLQNFTPTSEDFAELLYYAKMQNMCMRPGCTTCGCMPFRELVQSIGKEKMFEIIKAVTEEEIDLHFHRRLFGLAKPEPREYRGRKYDIYSFRSIHEWYDALLIIKVALQSELPDCVLVDMWKTHVEFEREIRREMREERLERERIEKERRQERREAIKKAKAEKLVVREAINAQKAAERLEVIKDFDKLSLEEKLTAIARDRRHTSDYYPLDLMALSCDDLSALGSESKEKLYVLFSPYKDRKRHGVAVKLRRCSI